MPGKPSDLRSGAAISALATLLSVGFDASTRKRGKSYVRQHAVAEVWEDETTVAGFVQGSAGEPYTATLTYNGQRWAAECSCPVGLACKHCYAVAQVWLDQAFDQLHAVKATSRIREQPPPPATRKKSFRETWEPQLAAKIGRALTAEEGQWLGKLSALFHDFRQQGVLTRHALRSSGFAAVPEPSTFNFWQPAFPGWWTDRNAPSDPWELWQYIAFDWDRHGRPLPPAFVPMTDLGAVRDRIGQQLIAEEVETWRRSLAQLAAPQPHLAHSDSERARLPLSSVFGDARVLLGPDGSARLQVRTDAAKPWRHPTQAWMNNIPQASYSDLQTYAEPARSLLTSLRLRGISHRYGLGREGRLDDHIFTSLLDHPDTRAAIVLPDDTPWRIEENPLGFHARPRADDSTHLDLQLTLPDGRGLPGSATPFAHADGPLYLINNRVWRGPAPLPTSRLPVAALADPAIATALESAGLQLPSDFTARVVRVPLRPRLRLWIEADSGFDYGRSYDSLHLTLHASADEPAVSQSFCGQGGWKWTRDGQPPPTTPDSPHYGFDLAAANAVAATLGAFQLQYYAGSETWTRTLSANFPEQFLAWRATLPADVEIETTPELAGLVHGPLNARVNLAIDASAASGQDWFDVSLSLDTGDLTLSDEELKLLTQARGGWVRLPRRGWQRLVVAEPDTATAASLAKLGLTVDPTDLLAARGRSETHRFHALQLAETTVPDAKLADRLRRRTADLRALPPPAPPATPATLTAALRPYQQDGYHYLAHLSALGLGGILADDMGLGKTVQTLAWLLWLRDQPEQKGENQDSKIQNFRALVVCPKSVVPNWVNEAARFAPSLATARIEPRQPLPDGSGLLVVNYTQLRLRAADLAAISWDAVVLDEGQNIKNPASATAAAARDLPARHRLVLTGTPIENRLLDLWSLVAFAQPGLLGTQAAFQRLYNEKQDPEGARLRLAARVRPFLLRRTKREVARDLPARTEEDLVCELEGAQRKLYDAELKRARQLLLKVENARQFDRERFNILQSLLRLRQICCDPRLVSTTLIKPASAKLEALLDTVEPLVAEGHRVLIFSQFVRMLELIRDELAARAIGHLMLTGQTENRQELVDTFQAPGGPPVFLLSLKAAGAGLNLTAASYVVLYDPWWNPAVEAQAIDRTHRIGQTANVIAYRLVAKDTIEEKIRALQREKAALAAAVVQEESLAKVMDLETLREVLG